MDYEQSKKCIECLARSRRNLRYKKKDNTYVQMFTLSLSDGIHSASVMKSQYNVKVPGST